MPQLDIRADVKNLLEPYKKIRNYENSSFSIKNSLHSFIRCDLTIDLWIIAKKAILQRSSGHLNVSKMNL